MVYRYVTDEILDNGIQKCHLEPIKTNADRIRSMTDAELAEWFCTMCNFGDFCPYKDDCNTNGSGVLKWLKEEVKLCK